MYHLMNPSDGRCQPGRTLCYLTRRGLRNRGHTAGQPLESPRGRARQMSRPDLCPECHEEWVEETGAPEISARLRALCPTRAVM